MMFRVDAELPFIDSLVGERIGTRYLVEEVLRPGGTGVVAARPLPALDPRVAIRFRSDLAGDAELGARFLAEARLASQLTSEHLVRILDVGTYEERDVPYLVMEMLEGRDLRDELDTLGAMPVALAVDYVLQAAVGLAELHALGIVHGAIEPSNLFVSEAGGTETIKVLDLGAGSARYRSPEQVKELANVGPRSDVWALGVLLYELLTNASPFGGAGHSISEIYGLIVDASPSPPRARKADLPPALEAVILACLKPEPSQRPASVGALAEALRPFAPVVSVPHIDAVHHALARSVPPRPAAETAKATTDPGRSLGPRAASRPSRAVVWGGIVAIVVTLVGLLLARR
jgi:serine/threonine protein kinase